MVLLGATGSVYINSKKPSAGIRHLRSRNESLKLGFSSSVSARALMKPFPSVLHDGINPHVSNRASRPFPKSAIVKTFWFGAMLYRASNGKSRVVKPFSRILSREWSVNRPHMPSQYCRGLSATNSGHQNKERDAISFGGGELVDTVLGVH
jgi:hypothetical protein